MSSKHIWRPEASYTAASLGSEEGGRGSLHDSSSSEQLNAAAKVKNKSIPRRRTPTVSIPPQANQETSETGTPSSPTDAGKPPAIYTTIENNKKQSLLELSHELYETSKPANPHWFCGWTECEILDLHRKPPPTVTGEGDRSRLQTPMDGYRSTLHSRASSSRYSSSHGRRRTYQYTFHHYETSEEYAEEYCQLYSFTAMNTGCPPRDEDERIYCEGEDVEQDAEVIFPLGVKSLYRGDPYLRELASRLGIREPPPSFQDWDRQQQLISPRPTPPSIVKKKRNGKDQVNIVVSNSTLKRNDVKYDDHDILNEECITIPSTDTGKVSRPVSSEATQKFGSVELPKISHSSQISGWLRQVHQSKNSKYKTNSVISVKNYLQVKSKNRETLVEEEEGEGGGSSDEEEALPDDSLGSSPHCSPSKDAGKTTGERSREAYQDGRDAKYRAKDSRGADSKAKHQLPMPNPLTQEHSWTLTQGQKEKLIRNTAHTLGVVSRDWTKIPGKMMHIEKSSNNSTKMEWQVSAPGRCLSEHAKPRAESGTGYRNEITTPTPANSGTGYRNEITTPSPANRREVEKPRAATVHRERSADEEKIKKLRSIYDSGGQPRNRALYSSRQPSRCNSRHPSRPATRMHGDRTQCHEVKGDQCSPSRPVTRIGSAAPSRPITRMRGMQNRVGNLDNLEESTYWNELPQENTKLASNSHQLASGNTAVFGVVDNGRSESQEVQKVAGSSRRAALRTSWNEDLTSLVVVAEKRREIGGKQDLSLMVAEKRREMGRKEDLSLMLAEKRREMGGKQDLSADQRREMGGKQESSDKIAQAIALAMKFRQPRESLMRKLTGGRSRRRERASRTKHSSTMVGGATGSA